jgi:hypothetical protein
MCGQDDSSRAGCTNFGPYVSLCDEIMSSSSYSTDPWMPMNNKVKYCLSERSDEQCKLEFSPQLAWVVVAFNLVKACILGFAFLSIKENPLMTMGDAVASFLTRRDDMTKDLCLMDKRKVKMWEKPGWANAGGLAKPLPLTFERSTTLWRSVVSRRRWVTCLGL